MARPIKAGLDYFPMDTREDRKALLIFSKFGLVGKGLTIALMEEIYGDNGYYYILDDDNRLMFASQMRIDEKFLEEYLDFAFKINLFSKEMYDKHSIITSEKIQETYFSAITRRKGIKYNSDYMLINLESDITDEFLNANDGSYKFNDGMNLIDVCKNTQSKEKKSKAEHSTQKQTTAEKSKAEHSTPKQTTAEKSKAEHSTPKHTTAEKSKAEQTVQKQTVINSSTEGNCLSDGMGATDDKKISDAKNDKLFLGITDMYKQYIGKLNDEVYEFLLETYINDGYAALTGAIRESVTNDVKNLSGVKWYVHKAKASAMIL